MKLSSGLAVAGALLLASAVAVQAQSLGDLAAKEAARRKEATPAKKTYTNDDSKKVEGDEAKSTSDKPASAPGPDAKDPKATKDAADGKPAAAPEASKADADSAKTESSWRGRITTAREDVRRNQAFAEALQSRINALAAEFSSRDDPAQRAQIADDRQKALAELTRVQTDISNSTKAIADIEEEARRAGVPPGWLR